MLPVVMEDEPDVCEEAHETISNSEEEQQDERAVPVHDEDLLHALRKIIRKLEVSQLHIMPHLLRPEQN